MTICNKFRKHRQRFDKVCQVLINFDKFCSCPIPLPSPPISINVSAAQREFLLFFFATRFGKRKDGWKKRGREREERRSNPFFCCVKTLFKYSDDDDDDACLLACLLGWLVENSFLFSLLFFLDAAGAAAAFVEFFLSCFLWHGGGNRNVKITKILLELLLEVQPHSKKPCIKQTLSSGKKFSDGGGAKNSVFSPPLKSTAFFNQQKWQKKVKIMTNYRIFAATAAFFFQKSGKAKKNILSKNVANGTNNKKKSFFFSIVIQFSRWSWHKFLLPFFLSSTSSLSPPPKKKKL